MPRNPTQGSFLQYKVYHGATPLAPEVSLQTAGLSNFKKCIVLNHQVYVRCVSSAQEINTVEKKSLPRGFVFTVLFHKGKRNEYTSETSKNENNSSVRVLE